MAQSGFGGRGQFDLPLDDRDEFIPLRVSLS
jgi:hypothetical protein